ncbi:hypothetical protein QOZ98_002444 [Planomicrobium stackebrandtii]|uniref:Holin n=1 Tax=Planomicrobium stackebrandtii TaxID=253160 RepID=A0ABU0GW64_9BACL|nr:hypothetical protein [Planomicrobium stackebrandtii]MDQ0429616.1 hypothetical protein [Planomicrobium stackebrandtii]
MDEITTQDWNSLVGSVGSIGDKTQNQLLRIQSQLEGLTDTLMITNILLGIIAVTFIISVVSRIFFKK